MVNEWNEKRKRNSIPMKWRIIMMKNWKWDWNGRDHVHTVSNIIGFFSFGFIFIFRFNQKSLSKLICLNLLLNERSVFISMFLLFFFFISTLHFVQIQWDFCISRAYRWKFLRIYLDVNNRAVSFQLPIEMFLFMKFISIFFHRIIISYEKTYHFSLCLFVPRIFFGITWTGPTNRQSYMIFFLKKSKTYRNIFYFISSFLFH